MKSFMYICWFLSHFPRALFLIYAINYVEKFVKSDAQTLLSILKWIIGYRI